MSHADPIADMLTRIRNAVRSGHETVNVKASGMCEGILGVLISQGFLRGYDRIETSDKQGQLRIQLKYGPLGEKVIHEIKRCSKPSNRKYCQVIEIPRVMGGMGIAILSTSQGMMTDKQCREKKVGGELLCTVC
jgi:small subunit ribosomal protein S8